MKLHLFQLAVAFLVLIVGSLAVDNFGTAETLAEDLDFALKRANESLRSAADSLKSCHLKGTW